MEEDKKEEEIFEGKANVESSNFEEFSKEGNEQNTRTLRNTLLVLGIIVVLAVSLIFMVDSSRHFDFNGLTGNVVKEGELIFYQTSFDVTYNNRLTKYNFYLRNNPEDLGKTIPFEGKFVFPETPNVVINSEEEFNCDGDGIIAIANMAKLYRDVLSMKVITDPEAVCENNNLYTLITLKSGEETRVEQTGAGCYDIFIKDCEVLKGTERLLIDTLLRMNGF